MKCVVFLPGILGSVLERNAEIIWPPSLTEFVFGYNRMNDLMSNDVRATGVIRQIGIYSVYGTLIGDFNRCGYTEGGQDKRLVIFPYDWRRSNVEAAEQLANELDRLNDLDPDLEITLVGHSMGGLILRYILESEGFDERPWFGKINSLLTLGTPHFGAPKAIDRLRGKESVMGLSGDNVKRLANDARFPSLYQLIPPENSAMTLPDPLRGEVPVAMDPFSGEIVEALEMNRDNITSARDFWSKLDTSKRPEDVDYFFFGGGAHKTVVRTQWNGFEIDPVARQQTGDGTVPIVSSVLAGVPHAFSEKKHEKVFTDRHVRVMLYKFLGAHANVRPQSAEAAVVGDNDAIGISLDKETYSLGEEIEIAVSYNRLVSNPTESFEVVGLDPASGAPLDPSVLKSITTRFDGVNLSSFSFSVTLDLPGGLYEVKPLRKVDDPERSFFVVR